MNEPRSAVHLNVETPPPETSSPSGWRAALVGGIALALVVGAIALRGLNQEEQAAAPEPFTVKDEKIQIADASPSWKYVTLAQAALVEPITLEPEPGRVAVDESRASPVFAPLQGRVEEVNGLLGQHVAEGDRLIEVRSAAIVDLFKERDVARAREAAKQKEVDRLKALLALHAIPEKDLVAAEHELTEEQLGRAASERKLASLSVSPDGEELYWIIAPRSGVVVERQVLRGDEVSPERDHPLMTIADLSEVVVTADVPESRVAQLEIGQQARVQPAAQSAQPLVGKVEYIGQVIDPERRMVSVRVRVPNPGHELRPNGFVEVAFAPTGAPRVVVESEAIVTDDRRSFAFVRPASGGDTLERREVTIGARHEDKIEILSGIEPGETYVRSGAILLLNAIDLAH
jgi:cobalt-zinc-cadmium efflux system membrane fusion protein